MAGKPNTEWLQTMIAKYGSREAVRRHQASVGRLGGLNGRGAGYTGGFAHPAADPQAAGAKGGRISRRRKAQASATVAQ